jgi:phosphate starvation-inducible PhoH-like protein
MRLFLLLQFLLLSKESLLCDSFASLHHDRRLKTTLNVKNLNVYHPKTETQNLYWNDLENNNNKLIIANGAAGTGKTLLACQHAIKELYDGNIDKIVITRPVVPVEEEIGFLPGTLQKKMDPWTRPIMDIFHDFHSKNNIKNMMKDNSIEISPLGFMRGRTFKNAIVIADEMQNSSPNQMLMLLTRLGTNSKIIITGDLKQCDKDRSGLNDLIRKLNIHYSDDFDTMKKDGIVLHNFRSEDVQRSDIVAKILDIYD